MIQSKFVDDMMRLTHIIEELTPVRARGPIDADITGVTYDSRLVMPGFLFAALPGQLRNGAEFVSDALQRGAAAILSEEELALPKDVTLLQVPHARAAMARVACAFHRHPSSYLEMTGVTGTNGKTTVAYLIREVLRADGSNPGLIGTVEYLMGSRQIPAQRTTPEAPELQAMLDQMRQAGCRAAVMEVSSHALDQHRVDGVEFDTAIFTNLTQDHLDYHEDFELYFAAKAKLFIEGDSRPAPKRVVINIDDPWGARLYQHPDISSRRISYGFSEQAMVRAEKVELSADGARFDLISPWGDTELRTPLLGRFNISNILAAVAACGGMGISPLRAACVLANGPTIPGRLERVPSPHGRVYVDYAHTEDALQNVLETLREVTPGRLIVVFGCGGNRDRDKRARMGRVAAKLADFSILTTDNPRKELPGDILDDIETAFTDSTSFLRVEDREEAIAEGVGMLKPDDLLLIAGKGHETYQEVGTSIIPFDDREIALRLLSAKVRN